jgi:Nickel responsive protein SCO4226-like
MPKFLAIHPIPSPITFEEAASVAKAAKANSTVDAYWVKSWAQSNNEGKIVKIFCEWNGKDAASVSEVLKKVPAPCEGPYPMTIVDAEDYR